MGPPKDVSPHIRNAANIAATAPSQISLLGNIANLPNGLFTPELDPSALLALLQVSLKPADRRHVFPT
jgi:hypothetical protein